MSVFGRRVSEKLGRTSLYRRTPPYEKHADYAGAPVRKHGLHHRDHRDVFVMGDIDNEALLGIGGLSNARVLFCLPAPCRTPIQRSHPSLPLRTRSSSSPERKSDDEIGRYPTRARAEDICSPPTTFYEPEFFLPKISVPAFSATNVKVCDNNINGRSTGAHLAVLELYRNQHFADKLHP